MYSAIIKERRCIKENNFTNGFHCFANAENERNPEGQKQSFYAGMKYLMTSLEEIKDLLVKINETISSQK